MSLKYEAKLFLFWGLITISCALFIVILKAQIPGKYTGIKCITTPELTGIAKETDCQTGDFKELEYRETLINHFKFCHGKDVSPKCEANTDAILRFLNK